MMKYLITLLCVSIYSVSFAQQTTLFFEHIGLDEGLSHPHVSALLRDSRGFLWIGTEGGGLNRFDGHQIVVYQHQEDDTLSICGNEILDIIEDKKGFIWVGTRSGISKLNPENGKAEHFTEKNGRLNNNWTNVPFLDNDRQIWTANANGLSRYNEAENRFIPVSLNFNDQLKQITGVYVAPDGTFWMSGPGIGVRSYHPITTACQQFYPFKNTGVEREWNSLNCILNRQNTSLWCASYGGGLLEFQLQKKQFNSIKMPHLNSHISDVTETIDHEGNSVIWAISDPNIVQIRKEIDQNVKVINSNNSNLPDQSYRLLYPDQHGNLWVGTVTNGVYRYSLRQDIVKTYTKLKSGYIGNFYFLKNDDVLLTGSNPAAVIIDPQKKVKKVFTHLPPNSKDRFSEMVNEAIVDKESDKIYFASFSGLTVYDRLTNKTEIIPIKELQKPFDKKSPLWSLTKISKTKFLVNQWIGKLYIFDIATRTLSSPISPLNFIIRDMTPALDGKIWISAEGYLLCYDPELNEIKTILGFDPDVRFYHFFKDSRARTWLATDKGLWLFNESQPSKSVKYTVHHGLPSDFIYKIYEDALNRLWLNTKGGIGYYDVENHQFFPLSRIDGFEFKFDTYAMAKAPDGNFWIGHNGEIQIFNPAKVGNILPSQTRITGFKVNNKDSLFSIPFDQIKEIRLKPGENVVQFNFTAADLEAFGKTQFKYRLEGLSENWIDAGKSQSAIFVQLPAGEYLFRVRPKEAGENERYDSSLKIVITDFLWQRKWFQIAGVTIFILLGFLIFFKWKSQQHRLTVSMLERAQALVEFKLKTTESEMKALRAQMNPHFIFNSLNSINAYILKNLPAQASSYLNTFSELMRRVLDNSANDSVSLEEELLLMEAYLQAESMRLDNKLSYSIEVDDRIDTSYIEVPSMILQPFLENSIWHGISPKPTRGHIMIKAVSTTDGLYLSVEDNGIGREQARSLRANQANGHHSKGLKLTTERVALYDFKYGTVTSIKTIDLNKPSGTRVEITIIRPAAIEKSSNTTS
ncbi:MAG: histidine kinase [Saprospiraceae bacterium]|nr:histidine kinase [Saprospiraceae bacterium]